MAKIKVKDLNWSYGEETILRGLNLNIEKGKFYSILGPNGSGKTTLLKNILKLLAPKKESIFIGDEDITNISTKEMAKKNSFSTPRYKC